MKVPRVWHPLLIGQIPLLTLWVGNRYEVGLAELVRPAAIVLGLSLVLWMLTAWAMKSLTRAALPVSVLLFGFFHFDIIVHLNSSLTRGAPNNIALLISAFVFLAIGVISTLGIVRILARPRAIRICTSFLNVISILVIAALLIQPARDATTGAAGDPTEAGTTSTPTIPGGWPAAGVAMHTTPRPARLPDVFYIILDGYARSDVLREIYDYDNRDFLDHLRKKGFFIASGSTSNYCQTFLSLSSSLNCRHHNWLARNSVPANAVHASLRHSTVLATLKQHGYRFVSYASNYSLTDFPDADVFRGPPTSSWRPDFDALLLSKTPLRLVKPAWSKATGRPPKTDRYAELRQRTLFTLGDLGRIARGPSPQFVFAHVVCPHPPFVFGMNGEDVSPHDVPYVSTDGSFYQSYYGGMADYVSGYRAQVAFISRLAEQAIDSILENAPEPPIIILQADHGAGSRWTCDSDDPAQSDLKERFGILNAYYLPGSADHGLYETITPVNSFRIVLNSYFGTRLEPLPDENYLSSVASSYEFVNVTSLVP